ncbi:MAG: insulinase family protein [Oscillospiraceae bacterium]|nr:insulinase family protein [Oscillospiraceae bacterium]
MIPRNKNIIIICFLTAILLLTLSGCSFRKKQEVNPSTIVEQAAADAGLPNVTELVESLTLAEEDEAELGELPQPGDTVCGFTVREVQAYPDIGAQCIRFEHVKTGAELIYIANSDLNRVFDLTFFTRAIDDTGLPHIFEHATLDGSEKYPSDDLFFNLLYQTYNTYMNATTGQAYTTYPVASLSEAQLLKYADFYLDSCMHPMLMEDENIFREEAWRYRLGSLEEDLAIEGTVYSEMRSAMDISSQAHYDWIRTCFPGATCGNNSGGDPAHIPEMTWEDLKAYHDLYYHPSNCAAYLYGKFEDYTAFLQLLDDEFSQYEHREFSFEENNYTPLTESVTAEYPYAVEEDFSTEGGTVVYYSFLCPGLKELTLDEMVLNTLTDLLMNDRSPMMKRLKEALPYGYFGTYFEYSGPQDMVVFYGMYLNREDAETFREIVDQSLQEVAEKGFEPVLGDGIIASLSIASKLSRESSSLGATLVSGQFVPSYADTHDPFYTINYSTALSQMNDWNQAGLYQHAVRDWLLEDDVITVLSITYSEPGLREQLNDAEKVHLAEVKASLSDEELLQIINRDENAWAIMEKQLALAGCSMKDFEKAYSTVIPESGNQKLLEMLDQNESIEATLESGIVPENLFREVLEEMFRQKKDQMTESESGAAKMLLQYAGQALKGIVDAAASPADTDSMVAELRAVDVRSLPEEVRNYVVHDETDEDGVRHLTAAAEVDDIGETLIMLDASGLPQEDLHWFALYLPMLGQLETSEHSQETLSAMIARYTYGWNASYAVPVKYGTKEYNPYLNTGFICLGEDLETAYNLAYEVLFETVFTDTEKLSGLIDRALASARAGISYGPYYLMINRHMGATEPVYAYSSYLSGLDYFAFLNEVSQMMKDDPAAVAAKLSEVQQLLKNRSNAITIFAGDPDLFESAAEQTNAFLGKLNNEPITPAVYEFDAPAKREALIIDSTVQYNGLITSFETMGLDGYTADLDAIKSLVVDTFLIPKLREQYGVYTPMHEFTEYGGYLLSYSDPNIRETFEVYDELPDFLKNTEVAQDTLDGYIQSSYSYLAGTDGELFGAISAVNRRICGIPDELRVERMKCLKSLTPEKVQEYAEAYQKLAEYGNIFTIGGSAAIHEHEDFYDLILDPLKDFS